MPSPYTWKHPLLIVFLILCNFSILSSETSAIPQQYNHRHLLTSSPMTTTSLSKKEQTGFLTVLDFLKQINVLVYIIGALVLCICCVSCCCLYYFVSTRTVSKTIKKLSMNANAPELTVHTQSMKSPSSVVSPTMSYNNSYPSTHKSMSTPPVSRESHPQMVQLSIKHSYKSNETETNDTYEREEKASCVTPAARTPKMTGTSTQISMDVDEIQLSAHNSANTQDSLSNGFVIHHGVNNSQYIPQNQYGPNQSQMNNCMQQQRQMNAVQNMHGVQASDSHTNRVINIIHSSPNQIHPGTIQPLSPMIQSNVNNGNWNNYSPQQYQQQMHNYNNNVPHRNTVAGVYTPTHPNQRYMHQQQFRFPPSPPRAPQAPHQNNYSVRVIPPPPPPPHIVPPPPPPPQSQSQFNLNPVPHSPDEASEMTYMTSSTVASLNTADFERDNSASASTTKSEQNYTTELHYRVGTTITVDTYATHTATDSGEVERIYPFVIAEEEEEDEKVYKEGVETGAENESEYMQLQPAFNCNDMMGESNRSMLTFDNQPSPEHSKHNTMIVNEDIETFGNNEKVVSIDTDDSYKF